ncbi:MAG: PRTRC system protein C [Bacteroidota bacterium]|nr:PRTRC system protein C [Bacteroidota bacterium]
MDLLKRTFRIIKNKKTIDLADPNQNMSPEEVVKFYASEYPEITSGKIDGPKVEGTSAIYSIKETVGTKG